MSTSENQNKVDRLIIGVTVVFKHVGGGSHLEYALLIPVLQFETK
jgi:hypothetical protein